MKTSKRRRKSSTPQSRPKVNLQEIREERQLSIQDIQVRTGIPLEHIEALETGIVPDSLKGRKLLRSKHRYLIFLGQPKNARLEVRRKRRRVEYFEPSSTTGSTEIEIPSTSKSIFTGFALAIGLVLGLKSLSLAMDNESFSVDTLIEQGLALANEAEITEDRINLNQQSLLTSTSVNPVDEQTTDNPNEELSGLVDDLLTITSEEEMGVPAGPYGPNSIALKAVESTMMSLICDGYIITNKEFAPGQQTACNYSHEANIYVSDISNVEIKQNERRIHPMGPQGAARRLSFVQK